MKSILFSGSSNLALTKELARLLGWPLGKIEISKFSDSETYVNVKEKIAGQNVFVLQSGNYPCNENFMELLIMIDALKRLNPRKIIVILPFYPYRRQEKRTEAGESVTAQLAARFLETAGADKIFIVDIHTDKILKFFKIPAANLEATALFINYFKKLSVKNLIVMAPDRGALKDARRFAKKIRASVAWAQKHRGRKHDKIASMKFHGSVKNKNVLIIDDEINTAGTLCEAAHLLKKTGARNIYAACTHPVFSGPAISRLKNSPIKEIVVTNTIYLPRQRTKPLAQKLKILSVSSIIAEAITGQK